MNDWSQRLPSILAYARQTSIYTTIITGSTFQYKILSIQRKIKKVVHDKHQLYFT